MTISKRWLTLIWPLAQASIAVNLGMALQRLDDGRASSLTVIAILMGVVGLALVVIVQTMANLAATKSNHIGSRP